MNIEGEEGDGAVINAEPVVATTDPAAVDPPVADGATTTDPEAEPKKGRKPADPLISEITKLRARTREQDAALEAARREAADARALADRLAKGDNGDGTGKPVPTPSQSLDDAEIDRRAEYKLFLREVADMRQQGEAAFGKDEFGSTIQSLTAYGADNDGFIRDVMAVDRTGAHALLREIADDPARAIGLVNMTPTQRIAELTRMSIASKTKAAPVVDPKPTTRAISSAPKPAPAISSTTSATKDWRSDKATDAEFTAGFNEMLKNRRARR